MPEDPRRFLSDEELAEMADRGDLDDAEWRAEENRRHLIEAGLYDPHGNRFACPVCGVIHDDGEPHDFGGLEVW